MNIRSKRSGPLVATLAVAGMALTYGAATFAYDLDEDMLALQGEFALDNGDSKIISDHRKPEPYRICVAKSTLTVPVKARFDGQQRTIGVGECENITAKVIALSPGGKLSDDEELIGKYEHVRN